LAAEGVFHVDAIVPLWKQFQQGERKWHTHLWNVLMFQAWQAHWKEARAAVPRA
jgi:asparagine synthase (glutamine-hydrolysing)